MTGNLVARSAAVTQLQVSSAGWKEVTMPSNYRNGAPQPRSFQALAPLVLALAGTAPLLSVPAYAEALATCPAAAAPILQSQPPASATGDSNAYRRQVMEFYQQHLTAYKNEAQQFASDAQLVGQFKAAFQSAKNAVIATTATDIANGIIPIGPDGAGTLTNADPLAPTQTTPVQIGARDLTALEDNLAVDRAALQNSCDALEMDRQILVRIDGVAASPATPQSLPSSGTTANATD
jgi:hypothetical protein